MPHFVVAPGLQRHVFVPGRYAEIERLGNFFEGPLIDDIYLA